MAFVLNNYRRLCSRCKRYVSMRDATVVKSTRLFSGKHKVVCHECLEKKKVPNESSDKTG